MGKPEIISYIEEWVGPPGHTLGLGDAGAARFIRRRPQYRSRPFHARWTPEGYLLRCRQCGTTDGAKRPAASVHATAANHARAWHGAEWHVP